MDGLCPAGEHQSFAWLVVPIVITVQIDPPLNPTFLTFFPLVSARPEKPPRPVLRLNSRMDELRRPRPQVELIVTMKVGVRYDTNAGSSLLFVAAKRFFLLVTVWPRNFSGLKRF